MFHHPHHSSFIDRIDPRVRVLAAGAFVAAAAVANGWLTLGILLAACAAGLLLVDVRSRHLWRRLVPINAVMLVLLILLPLTTAGQPLARLGPLEFTGEGLRLALLILLKGNAILLALTVLLGSMEMTTLGHTFAHLRVPDKLTHLLLFTVRYVDVLRRENHRLHTAMKMRGFRPRMDRHTYRAYGYLVGMLLVRSLDRAERIVAAMKCRGFRGRFYLLDHFAVAPRRDVPFALVCLVVLLAVVWVEWL
jgi:cobalt/nickel transport system permease protein